MVQPPFPEHAQRAALVDVLIALAPATRDREGRGQHDVEAFIHVTVRQAELPRIREELAEIPEIVQAHGMSGQIDLVARVAARDTRHLFDVDARILAIDGVERTETSLVMGEVIPYRVGPLMELARRER
jgi:DNA-binding Lrp family transcriptional regulator